MTCDKPHQHKPTRGCICASRLCFCIRPSLFFSKKILQPRGVSVSTPLWYKTGGAVSWAKSNACGTRSQFRADVELGLTGIFTESVAFSLPYVDAAAYLPTKPALSSPLKDPS